jgi:hypothetical protein
MTDPRKPQEQARHHLGSVVPNTALQCLAAVLSGCTTSVLTNPLDLVRARVQVGVQNRIYRRKKK